MDKTVFILGAGFAIDAGAPPQEKIISRIFEVSKDSPGILKNEFITRFREFLSQNMNIPNELHDKIPLEDVFTPLDRCILDRLSFRELSLDKVKEMRDIIYFLIGKTLEHILRNSNKAYIDSFAKYIVELCRNRSLGRYREIDPVSIIGLNWDITLDSSIYELVRNRQPKGVIDYCCYISSYDPFDESVKPGLEVLGQGGFNVKYLKLHGSLNWLQCPRCQRNYVDMVAKIAVSQYDEKVRCHHCNLNFSSLESHTLVSNMIMPTFLKDFTNPQYKLIWQNAAIELSEAKKIVFIGYSLPNADFEMRQLLSRMVRKDAVVEVVDKGESETADNIMEITSRYEIFFGSRLKKPIYWEGARKYALEELRVRE